jgi:uncharacterized protein YggU (UPF0235/DUF167 family)
MYVHVKVHAGAKKEDFVKLSETQFKISVKEKAEQNMANRRVIELVASEFGLPPGKVRIVSGHHSPSKILVV